MVLIRPRERVILNAIRRESRLKQRAKRMHKRFRSWAQHRVRQYWMPMNVNLTADTSLMDGQYIAACVQKSATLRKHDLTLWYNYSKRILELAGFLTPQQFGYIFYGYGKSRFLDESLYRGLLPYILEIANDFYSHPLMCILWALNRVQIKDDYFLLKIGETIIEKIDVMRPADLIKIANVMAKMGITNGVFAEKISGFLYTKLETIFAQEFRNAMCDVTIVNLYNDELKTYILTRFSKIFICARPQHFQEAYKSAVAIRVLHPQVWYNLSKAVRGFYIRLSMRRIPHRARYPSRFHWDVSNCLAKMQISHRNTFQWGCYWIDIAESEDKRSCWFVDGPNAFYTSTNQYRQAVKLQHRILSELGWKVKRVRWDDWCEFLNDENGEKKKMEYLTKLRQEECISNVLADRDSADREVIKQKLKKIKDYSKLLQEKKEKEKEKLQFLMHESMEIDV